MEFLDRGDAAPNGRYTYRYTQESLEVKLPDSLTDDMVVLKSGSYNAFVGRTAVRLVDDNTNGVLLASGNRIYLPKSFVEKTWNISCEGEKTYNHYGIEYICANELLEKAGKIITVDSCGLVVISPLFIDNTDTIEELYRTLS